MCGTQTKLTLTFDDPLVGVDIFGNHSLRPKNPIVVPCPVLRDATIAFKSDHITMFDLNVNLGW